MCKKGLLLRQPHATAAVKSEIQQASPPKLCADLQGKGGRRESRKMQRDPLVPLLSRNARVDLPACISFKLATEDLSPISSGHVGPESRKMS